MSKRTVRDFDASIEDQPLEKKAKDTNELPSIDSLCARLSKEQKNIVELVCEGKNVLVSAKAGSGKTSVSLAAAYQFHKLFKSKALMITYNSRLKTETRERISKLNLCDMVECHSYHALAYKYFVSTHTGAADDSLIHGAMQVPSTEELDFGLVIIDEAQDMNELYASFVQYLLSHLKSKPQMLLLGDGFQRLYGFNGATDAYLTDPKTHFGSYLRSAEFTTRHMSISWRISHEMAAFINTNLNPNNLQHSVDADWWATHKDTISAWWGRGIRANPARKPEPNSVKIIRGWGARDAIQASKKMFKQYGNDQVALLAFSLKGTKSPIHAIVDKLGKEDNENWVVLDGKQSGSDDVIKGKRVASTVHRMKGLERDGILFCGLDAFIEKLYIHNPIEAFNIMYVACTRAKRQLIINITGTDYATIRCSPLLNNASARQCCTVSQLIEYVPFDEVLSVSENLFEARVIQNHPLRALKINHQSFLVAGRAPGTMEDLTPFLSRAISFRLMLLTYKQLYNVNTDAYIDDKHFDHDMLYFITDFYGTPYDQVTWPNLIKYAIAYETLKSRYTHLWRQLSNFELFDSSEVRPESVAISQMLEKCTENAMHMLWQYAVDQKLVIAQNQTLEERAELLKPLLEFESTVAFPFYVPWFTKAYTGQISGSIDILFNDSVVMGIECNESISGEIGLELELYASMKRLQNENQSVSTMMLLTNSAQLVKVALKLQPLHPKIPIDYEFIHRVARRKMQLKAGTKDEVAKDLRLRLTDNSVVMK